MPAQRIRPEQAHEHLEANPDALLVCGYDSDEKFRQYHLEGAIALDEFLAMKDSTSKDAEIIFYCA